MRILAIDYGKVRTGIAITDPFMKICYGLKTINTKKESEFKKARDRKILKELEEILNEYSDVETIVIGMPYNENGTKGERALETEELIHKIRCKFPKINLKEQDERYTSIEAHDIMRLLGVSKHKKNDVVDQIAAQCILEDYLKRINNL